MHDTINLATGQVQHMVYLADSTEVNSDGVSLAGLPKGMEQVLAECNLLNTLDWKRGHDQAVGVYPAISFKNTLMPHLESLSLHNFALEPSIPDYDVVEFIVRHKRTLTSLTLDECSIDGGKDARFTRLWGAVLRRFEVELCALRVFALTGVAPRDVTRDARFRYTYLSVGHGYLWLNEEVVGEELDVGALESLMAVVESRQAP
ncbi:hypothetical protein B0H10DRAFT_2206583 [Mycena sp. CBHHK59/15]|nr:hypothetical protein B0H10DRAFT_2206583 [Mycena sp. CBHHK59/15]